MFYFFFFNDTATTEIYTLSLHDALPICIVINGLPVMMNRENFGRPPDLTLDRKSTRLNSSHANISYAVFCLKKKKIDELGKLKDLPILLNSRNAQATQLVCHSLNLDAVI